MMLRDMGNGVTRVEACDLLPSSPCPSSCEALGCVRLVFPLADRVLDALDAALFYLDARAPAFSEACYRFVSSGVTEFFFW